MFLSDKLFINDKPFLKTYAQGHLSWSTESERAWQPEKFGDYAGDDYIKGCSLSAPNDRQNLIE